MSSAERDKSERLKPLDINLYPRLGPLIQHRLPDTTVFVAGIYSCIRDIFSKNREMFVAHYGFMWYINLTQIMWCGLYTVYNIHM